MSTKRSGASGSSSNMASKKTSKRKADNDDSDVICLDDEPNFQPVASTSKKKRVEGTSVQGVSSSNGGSKGQPLYANGNQKGGISRAPQPSVSSASPKASKSGSQKENVIQNVGRSTTNTFKVPDVPTIKSKPVAVAATTSTVIPESSESEKPTDKQLEITETSRKLRKAFMEAISDSLGDLIDSQTPPLETIVENIESCIPSRFHVFGNRRYPGGTRFEDFSSDAEVEEFTQWWLFGITGLLFSHPETVGDELLVRTQRVLRNLCQLLAGGHPSIVDTFTLPVIGVLRDLLAGSGQETGCVSSLKLNLYNLTPQESKVYQNFEIVLNESNKWMIPHYLQAIAPLIFRISNQNVRIFYTMNHLLKKRVTRLMGPDDAESVFRCFPINLLADAHSCFLREKVFCQIFKAVIQLPLKPDVNLVRTRIIFNSYAVSQPMNLVGFLSGDIGIRLLKLGLMELMHSENFSSINYNDLNDTILKAITFVIQAQFSEWSDHEVAKALLSLNKIASKCGLDAVLHPLIEYFIVQEILWNTLSSKRNKEDPLQPKLLSKVWDTIFQKWEDALTEEFRSWTIRGESKSSSPEAQTETLSFLTSTTALMKLVQRVVSVLKREGFVGSYEFFTLRNLQRWSDVCFYALPSALKLNSSKLPLMYAAFVETLVCSDLCNWFVGELEDLPIKFLSNLLAVSGWRWLCMYERNLIRPVPAFTKAVSQNQLRFTKKFPLLFQKTLRSLRLEVFRPFYTFVAKVYMRVMENSEMGKDDLVLIELLGAIADGSWVFKTIPFEKTFVFLQKLISSNSWKVYPAVRLVLAKAIIALPCLYSVPPKPKSVQAGVNLPLTNDSSPCRSRGIPFTTPESQSTISASQITQLENRSIKIIQLSLPILRSKFVRTKLTLAQFIMSALNRPEVSSPAILESMIKIAFDGSSVLCEEIFRQIGLLVIGESGLEGCTNNDIAQRLFSSTIPKFCHQIRSKNENKRLSVKTREKLLKGILQFSSAGPLSLDIFVEILKCIIPIVSQNKASENSVTIIAQKIVAKFAEVHCCQAHELITRVRQDISKCIVDSVIREFFRKNMDDRTRRKQIQLAGTFIERLKYIGKFRLSFVAYFYPALLELIVPNLMNPENMFLLTCLASHAHDTESAALLQEYISNYFPTLLLEHSPEKISHCLKFLKTKLKFDTILHAKLQEQRIINEMLLKIHEREEKVLRCLNLLCSWDQEACNMLYNQGTAPKTNRTVLQELLSKRLLGFFIHLDTKMQSRLETVETKQKILQSFTALMRLMGKNYITPVKSKVYKTLYSATKEGSHYHEVVYNAWKEFANCLDNPNFIAMITQIVASMLPLLESETTKLKVNGLIHHFVRDKEELTAPYHKELYFLLDHCEDQTVLKSINGVVDKIKQTNWSAYFNMIVKEASNENPPIRYEALRKLRDIFRFDWELVEKHVLVKGNKYVSQMISTLLAGLHGTGSSEDQKLREVIVDCFGCLGALDPVRFRSEADDGSSKRSLSTSLAISCKMNTFVVLYLGELVREFQEVKDTTTFDYCACLIQIVLKEINVKQDDIWEKLTKEQKEVITPMFTTKYQMETGMAVSNFNTPIYMSEHGQNFESWIINWMCLLISHIRQDQEPQAYALFRKSMNVLKTNVRIATFIIPFVAMYAVFCANKEQSTNIVVEITTVLDRWMILDEMKQKTSIIAPVRDSEVDYGLKDEQVNVENESVFHARCTQVVFSILDHFLRSTNLARRKLALKRAAEQNRRMCDPSLSQLPMSERDMRAVECVLAKIPKILISEVACYCGSYPAALYYLEQELKSNPFEETVQNNVDYLQRLYICLDDMDSVSGVASLRTRDQSFACQILENIVEGKTQESIVSLEDKSVENRDDYQLHQALARAYLKVDRPSAAERFIKQALVAHPEWETDLQEVHMDTLTRLQMWPELNSKVEELEEMQGNLYLEKKFLTWNIVIPRVVSKIQMKQTTAASELVAKFKSELIAPLVATCEDMYPYKRAYPNFVQLHILTEIDEAIQLIHKYSNGNDVRVQSGSRNRGYGEVKQLIRKWDARLWNVTKSRNMIDQILNVRKSIFEVIKTTFHSSQLICDLLDASIRECWLDGARNASKCGDFARADNCLLEAKRFMSPKVMIEEAKILNRKGQKENAITILQKGITDHFPHMHIWKTERMPNVQKSGNGGDDPVSALIQSKLLCSKALLLLAKLCEEEKMLDMEGYIVKYKEPVDVYKESEKNFFALGSYHDRVWSSSEKTLSQSHFDIQATVVRYYSYSLQYGCKYVYQSLPRLLSIWFDFAAGIQSGDLSRNSSNSSNLSNCSDGSYASRYPIGNADGTLDNMNSSISRMNSTVPPYILMTAFTQLVSRLCHSHVSTWQLLKEIIVRIICSHPHQGLWMTVAVSKSVNPMRRRRCTEIYKSVEKQDRSLKESIKDYLDISEKLIHLCDKQVPRESSKVSLNQLFDKLPKLLRSMGPGRIVVPFQVFINLTLPRKGTSQKDHNPYPEALVFIDSIDDKVELMASLIRPKKISIRATNGKSYDLLCKPKDDLRKDNKVMEVNNVVNWYLSQNSESSQRRLHVRTYSVVPLNEECGLLEWVPNLSTFRSVCLNLYKEKGISHFRGGNPIDKHDLIELKRRKFIDIMLRQTPPVFGDWFFNQFNDHQSWYNARMSYTRTAAVISIVGYIMGLGDRHGENILLDTTTGEVVHVDFNCLFNKGETFDWAERVPFRLTHNMVDGMGPLKYEGVFRKSCEIVMNTFREHKTIFLSVLRPFVFDPLVEWQKRERGALATLEAGELTNEKAVETMKYIKNRLDGTARNMMKVINTELSVQSHVKYLIEEATSIDNLCQMWIGWAAYM